MVHTSIQINYLISQTSTMSKQHSSQQVHIQTMLTALKKKHKEVIQQQYIPQHTTTLNCMLLQMHTGLTLISRMQSLNNRLGLNPNYSDSLADPVILSAETTAEVLFLKLHNSLEKKAMYILTGMYPVEMLVKQAVQMLYLTMSLLKLPQILNMENQVLFCSMTSKISLSMRQKESFNGVQKMDTPSSH